MTQSTGRRRAPVARVPRSERPQGGTAPASKGSGTRGQGGKSSGRQGPSGGSGGTKDTKDQASDAARDVGGTAKQEARETADTARVEASAVADTARDEASTVAQTGLQALQRQAEQQTDQLADRIYDLRDELDALLAGQPEHAGQVGEVAQQLAERLSTVADRVGEAGPQGLLDDARDLAGRRPGVFLLGAAVAGFGVGRLLRGTRDADDELVERERQRVAEDDAQ